MTEGLLKKLDSLIPVEIIDGSDVRKTADMVMLDVAYTPVVEFAFHADPATSHHNIQKPVKVIKELDRYCLVYEDRNDFRWVSADTIKEMRARYLLMRGFYSNNIDRFPHSERGKIIAWYFPDGFFDMKKFMEAK